MANKVDAQTSSEWFIPVKNRTIESAALFNSGKELCILHNDAEYKLRLTGNGKLILTK